jgi:hypothetical protein
MLGPLGQQAEDVAEVRPRLDVAEATTCEERREGSIHRAAVIATYEEPVLAPDGFAAERELAHVVVNGQSSVFEEPRETDPLIARVTDAVGDGCVIEDRPSLGVAPREERVDDGSRALLSERLFLLAW